ncbi:uncharacterized protein LOC142230581 [Haematobia irritans]|uniref:uncharacterized protein LOC142230581 n=1 Tax=Haematobia irritans TaxID=7368 RepID=UPI003F4FE356
MRTHKKHKQTSPHRPYTCRLCRREHALRKCNRFLSMNVTQREHAVKSFGYCVNCLAHKHSDGTCFTKTGCRICHQNHHTLLHSHPWLQSKKGSTNRDYPQPSSSKSTKPFKSERPTAAKTKSSSSDGQTSLSALFKQNSITLLPTILVNIETKNGNKKLRCILDSGARTSIISSNTVDKLNLTTLALDNETICPLTLTSIHDSTIQVQTILKTTSRVSMTTPKESVAMSIKKKFDNLMLADVEFYKSGRVDIIFGVDIYAKIVSEGIIHRDGLPTAQNTIFGWTLYGLCPK